MADAADIVNGYEFKSGRRNRFVQHEGGRRIDQVWDKTADRRSNWERRVTPKPAIRGAAYSLTPLSELEDTPVSILYAGKWFKPS